MTKRKTFLGQIGSLYRDYRSVRGLVVERSSLESELAGHFGRPVRLQKLHGSGASVPFLVVDSNQRRIAVLKAASRWRERKAYRVNILKRNFRHLEPAQRFVREHEILMALAPHGLTPEPMAATEHYLLQAYVEGPLVAELLSREDPRGQDRWLEGLEALLAMHRLGVAHGDARPTNAIVSDECVKFFDFEHCLNSETVSWEQQQAFDVLRYLINTFHPKLVTDASFADEALEFLRCRAPEAVWREFPATIEKFGLRKTQILHRLSEEADSRQALTSPAEKGA